jgi:replicative DNA helicase
MTRGKSEEPTRTLPSNLEAERSVLGAILIDNTAFHSIAETLTAGAFFRDSHRRMFKAIVAMLDVNQVVDLVTLKERLEQDGDLDEVGGPAYVASLVDGVPRGVNIAAYAAVVREKALLRSLIFTANKVLGQAYEADQPPAEILRSAEEQFFELQHGHVDGRMVGLGTGLPALTADLEWRVKHRGELTGITTGFESVDRHTAGWQKGDLIVIAARPSIGKTTFVMNSIVAACRAGKRVAMFSLEMRRRQLEWRILSSLANVPMVRIRAGEIGGSDYAAIAAAQEIMFDLPLWIDDTAGRTAWDIRSACRRLKAEDGLDEVVVDYAQLMPGTLDRHGASRNDEMTDISRRLKHLADELSVPIILLSQMNRASDKRPDPRPKLSDLRESGALEQDADVVAFLHRKNHREGGLTYFIIEKERNGPTGTLKLTLDRDIVLFSDAPNEPEPEPAKAKEKPTKVTPPTLIDKS